MLRDNQGQAAWRDVYQTLRREIDTGMRAPGTNLPTITELARSTGLTPHGARRVFDTLRNEGRIQSWQGKGARVATQLLCIRFNKLRPTFHELVYDTGRQAQSKFIRATTARLHGERANRLTRKASTKAIMTETLRQVDNRTVALSIDYFPVDRFEGIAGLLAKRGSVSWALSEHGITSYRRDTTSFEARLPTAHEALLLDIPRAQPVYATLGANIDPRGDVFQISTGVLRADCVQFEL